MRKTKPNTDTIEYYLNRFNSCDIRCDHKGRLLDENGKVIKTKNMDYNHSCGVQKNTDFN